MTQVDWKDLTCLAPVRQKLRVLLVLRAMFSQLRGVTGRVVVPMYFLPLNQLDFKFLDATLYSSKIITFKILHSLLPQQVQAKYV